MFSMIMNTGASMEPKWEPSIASYTYHIWIVINLRNKIQMCMYIYIYILMQNNAKHMYRASQQYTLLQLPVSREVDVLSSQYSKKTGWDMMTSEVYWKSCLILLYLHLQYLHVFTIVKYLKYQSPWSHSQEYLWLLFSCTFRETEPQKYIHLPIPNRQHIFIFLLVLIVPRQGHQNVWR